ncbi:hypothetical protein JOF53_000073 [Crossiella equi]|uniref:Uncharacterized protein n=1 Tax=Crossiella equi TaxID=130796 RepID=A0ABS5A3P6_9PSEU|nr:hypothetical protein [Crossiella equi]MBP2471201.1 hypothetical protein [Crossiella equi]
MTRSLDRLRLAVTGALPGELAVGGYVHPDHGPLRGTASALVAAGLRRQGHPARHTTGFRAGGEATLFAVSSVDRRGVATGFGVAAHNHDPAGLLVAERTVDLWVSAFRARRLLVAAADPLCASLTGNRTPVHVLGRPSHVMSLLDSHDLVFVDELAEVPDGAAVAFASHTATVATHIEAAARNLRVLDGPDAPTPPPAPGLDTTCRARGIRAVAGASDVVLVLGPAGTPEVEALASSATGHGARVRVAEVLADVRRSDIAVAHTVGLVEASSAAPSLRAELTGVLSGLGPLAVVEERVSTPPPRLIPR